MVPAFQEPPKSSHGSELFHAPCFFLGILLDWICRGLSHWSMTFRNTTAIPKDLTSRCMLTVGDAAWRVEYFSWLYNPRLIAGSIQHLKRFRIIHPMFVDWSIHFTLFWFSSAQHPAITSGCHRIGSCCTPAVAEATSGPKSCAASDCWTLSPLTHQKGRWTPQRRMAAHGHQYIALRETAGLCVGLGMFWGCCIIFGSIFVCSFSDNLQETRDSLYFGQKTPGFPLGLFPLSHFISSPQLSQQMIPEGTAAPTRPPGNFHRQFGYLGWRLTLGMNQTWSTFISPKGPEI